MKNVIVTNPKPEWLQKLPFEPHDLMAGAATELGIGSAFVYITEGRVLVSAVGADGGELFSHVCGKGAIVGLERLDPARIHETVCYQLWALTDARIERIELSAALDFLGELPLLARTLAWSLLAALDQRTGSHDFAGERVFSRLAMFLRDTTVDHAPLRLPRFVMARILRMRPETLSRALKELERRGAVSLKPRLRVMNRDELDKIITLGV